MNIHKLIHDTLTPLNVPVNLQTYSGKAPMYITYHVYDEMGEEWAENEEIATGYYIQVDVWSAGDYLILVDNVKAAMKAAGFKRDYAQDFYENDTKIFHKAIRFNYID